jgi:hypothetical protein
VVAAAGRRVSMPRRYGAVEGWWLGFHTAHEPQPRLDNDEAGRERVRRPSMMGTCNSPRDA